jgi:ABC-2 type transport system permease protein
MSSKAISDAPGKGGAAKAPRPAEVGPSVIREDEPGIARYVGMAGAMLVVIGGFSLALQFKFSRTALGPGWSTFLLAVGLVALLYHAAFDRDVQFRRIYMAFSYAAMAVGAFLCVVPYEKVWDQFPAGFLCLSLGLVFFLAYLRNEDDRKFREIGQRVLLGTGAVLLAVGLVGGNLYPDFLPGIGLLLGLLGLVYVVAFLGSRGVGDDLAYYVGLGLGGVAAVLAVIAIVRSAFYAGAGGFALVPHGLLLLLLAAFAGLVSLGFCSDARLVVLTRRELGALFYSPLAYFVLFAFTVIGWITFWFWLGGVARAEHPLPEPILAHFLGNILFIIVTIAAVPVLTMRSFSEEKRTGTLEVMLTTPVDESLVVLSKFFAALFMFLLVWLPIVLFLVALRVVPKPDTPFDYRPALSFTVALVATAANFISFGLLCSSLTRNQLISGVLTFSGMMLFTCVFMLKEWLHGPVWDSVIDHATYLALWSGAAQGKLFPPWLLFHVSLTVLFLFITVKVLEARKWA